jgi:predicted phage terminase large subunit-like protein
MNPKERLNLMKQLKEAKEKKARLEAELLPVMAKENYSAYVEYAHRYDKRFKLAPFQRYICDCIDKLLNNELLNDDGVPYEGIVVEQPPQTGKTTTITATLPSYYLGRNPYDHAILLAYGEDLAVKFGRRNKQKVEEYGHVFNQTDEKSKVTFEFKLSPVSSAALDFEIDKTNGGMISRGIGGAITGNPGDLIIIDDPYKNRQEADSPVYQKFVIDEWLNTIQTRASAKCKYVVVHTRWNEDDLIGYLLQNEPDKWFEVRFPAIAEEDEPHIGRKLGEALLPEAGKDIAWLIKKRESYEKDPMEGGIRAWNALYQQRPSSLEGNMIKRDYWKRFTLTLDMQKAGYFPVKVQSWDCALKDTSDPVAGQVWGKRGSNYYLIDHKGGRMDIVETMKGIADWNTKHPDAMAKLIEDKANGPAAMRILRDKISGLIPVNPGTKSKAERVSMVLPLWQAGNVYIPDRIETKPGVEEPCLWANDIIEQCAAFKPDKKVQRDDEVDCCSQSLNWLYFQPANLPESEQHYNFDFERPNSDNSYFGSIPGEDYFSGGY